MPSLVRMHNMEQRNPYRYELTIPSDLSALVSTRTFVESSIASCGFPDTVVQQIVLAVDEACSNVIRHGYANTNDATLKLLIETTDKGVTISIIDSAKPFNPLQVQAPDMQEYFRTFQHGGLGVHLIRRIMDSIEYIPSSSSHPENELRLVKLLPVLPS